ncbi:MAG: Sec-independent protein translocase protein TatB [Nitrospiraceae bacterium]|nr:Sec-independent protein translocase protein TatB [Nitrospiraceae bacterium]
MFGDFQELLVIFVIALLVVGPKKLPEFARQLGKIVGELKRTLMEARVEIDREIAAEARKEEVLQTNQEVLEKRNAMHSGQEAPAGNEAAGAPAPGQAGEDLTTEHKDVNG